MTMKIHEDIIYTDGDLSIGGYCGFYGYYYPSTAAGVTAFAGGGLANATQLADYFSNITTCANPADSVKLAASPVQNGGFAGPMMVVKNSTANAADVYPGNVAHSIDALGAGNPYSLGSGLTRSFIPTSATTWVSF